MEALNSSETSVLTRATCVTSQKTAFFEFTEFAHPGGYEYPRFITASVISLSALVMSYDTAVAVHSSSYGRMRDE
jgi:hypothetical protein